MFQEELKPELLGADHEPEEEPEPDMLTERVLGPAGRPTVDTDHPP